MIEPRNPEYLKVKELIEEYFSNLAKGKESERILFKLKNYSLPLN